MFDSVRKENPKSFFNYNDQNLDEVDLEGMREQILTTYIHTYIIGIEKSANNEKSK